MFRVAFVDTLGLCYDGSTLSKRGLGGSESAVILMSRELSRIGFHVTVFNDCISDDARPGVYDNVIYRSLHDIEQYEGKFDIFIASRSVMAFAPNDMKSRFKWAANLPNIEKVAMSARMRILWMHDTFCDGDDLIEEFVRYGRIHEIFTLSDWHTTYVTNCNHGKRRNFETLKKHIFQTRNGIQKHIDWVDVSKKDRNLFVYNASVSKGMIPLVEKVWPLVKKEIPEAKLKIIGGYYRFRSDHGPDEQEKKFHELKAHAEKYDIEFTGIIRQDEIAEILARSYCMIYPAAFPETFGISSLESLAYNTPIITCRFGALEETAFDLACYKIPYAIEPNVLFPDIDHESQVNRFASDVVDVYRNTYLHQQKMYACNQIKDICTWDTVALQWKQHFYKSLGEYLSVDEYRNVSRINNRVHKVFGRRFANLEEVYVHQQQQQKIVAIVPVYNAENYIEKCLRSIAAQNYDNYKVIVIDDCSTDNTRSIIRSFVESDERFELVANERNYGAVYNQVHALRQCDENDIVMLIDGDDALVNNPNIFHMYNNMYHEGAEYTYGSCWSMADNIPLIAQPYPPEIKERRAYREYKFNWNMPYPHLRTFIARIAKNLSDSVFQDENGEWYRAGGDNATFYNIIEQADPEKVVCVSDIMYLYNDMNPLNDYKVHSDEQNETANKIIGNKMTKKILIAIPTAKYIESDTFKSIYDLEVPEGYETKFQYFYGYNIDQVRNLIADWVVSGYDYLFSVDSDISFSPDTLKKLLSHEKDMVCGIYRQRLPKQTLEIYDLNIQNIAPEYVPKNSLIEIGGCGFGCVLVKKQVFVDVGYPQFEYHSALNHANTFSEDNDFCKKARAKGYKIYCDTSILCGHHGSMNYAVELPENPENDRLLKLSQQKLLPMMHVMKLQSLRDEGFRPDVIYDIGSCVLHWTNEAKNIFPNAKFCLFEAMDEVEFLYEGYDYSLGVLTDEDNKQVEFYQNVIHPGGNSYYRENTDLSPMALDLFPEEKKVHKIGMTLDTIVREKNFPMPDLIKMDVQGAEMDILKGATETLKNCKYVILELQHVDYNKGAPKSNEVIEYMQSIGFENLGNFTRTNVDGDYLFMNSNQSLLE